ncbi:MAG: hypothetical protein ABEJ36_05395 [Candidatus Nanosalina sp.]
MAVIPGSTPVFHGGDDDLNNALAHLSWKEMAIMTGIILGVFALILLISALTNQ